MSWSAMEWAVEQDCGDAQSKIVLVVIAKHANKKLQAFPSVSRIAKLANMSPRSVHNFEYQMVPYKFVNLIDLQLIYFQQSVAMARTYYS